MFAGGRTLGGRRNVVIFVVVVILSIGRRSLLSHVKRMMMVPEIVIESSPPALAASFVDVGTSDHEVLHLPSQLPVRGHIAFDETVGAEYVLQQRQRYTFISPPDMGWVDPWVGLGWVGSS